MSAHLKSTIQHILCIYSLRRNEKLQLLLQSCRCNHPATGICTMMMMMMKIKMWEKDRERTLGGERKRKNPSLLHYTTFSEHTPSICCGRREGALSFPHFPDSFVLCLSLLFWILSQSLFSQPTSAEIFFKLFGDLGFWRFGLPMKLRQTFKQGPERKKKQKMKKRGQAALKSESK